MASALQPHAVLQQGSHSQERGQGQQQQHTKRKRSPPFGTVSFLPSNCEFALTGRSGAGGTGPESTAGAELIVGSWNALAGVLAVEYLQQADAASIAALAGELVIARLSATPGSSHLCNAATQTMCILETRPILSVMLDCGTVSLNTVWVRTRKSLQPLHCAHVK